MPLAFRGCGLLFALAITLMAVAPACGPKNKYCADAGGRCIELPPVMDAGAETDAEPDAAPDAPPDLPAETPPVEVRPETPVDLAPDVTDARDAASDARDAATDVRDVATDVRDARG